MEGIWVFACWECSLLEWQTVTAPKESEHLHLAARSPQHNAQVFIKVGSCVLVVHLDLVHAQAVHPRHEARQGCLSRPTHSNQQQMALRLAEDTIDAKNMVKHFIEEYQRHIEFFFVENLWHVKYEETSISVILSFVLLSSRCHR